MDQPEFRGYRKHLAVLASYTLITLVMSYPLVFSFTTHVPGGGGDSQIFLWNLWWFKKALASPDASVFYTDYIFYPYTVGLSLHSYVLLNDIASVPLQWFLGLVTINNIFVVVSFAVSAFGMFLLAKRLVGDWRAAFVGGLIFAFCPYKWAHLHGHMHYTMTLWMPLYVLFLLRSFDEGGNRRAGLRWAVTAGVMLGFNFLSESYYFIFMLMFTAMFVLWRVLRRDLGRAAFYRLLATGATAFVMAVPTMYFVVKDVFAGRVRSVPGEGQTDYLVDLLGFFSPSPDNPFVGGLSFSGTFAGTLVENTAYVGMGVLFLLVLCLIRARKEGWPVRFWVVCAAVFGVFSLGTSLHVLGQDLGVPLPARIFAHVPVLENLRAPGRFDIAMMLAVAVLASYGLLPVLKKWKWAWLFFALLITVEYSAMPVAMFESRVNPVYETIRDDVDAEAVLEVPFFLRDGFNHVGKPMESELLNQTVHGKKIFSGVVARLGPERIFLSFLNLPVIRNLALSGMGLRVLPKYMRADKRLAGTTVDLLGIDYVVVHKRADTMMAHQFLQYVMPMKKIYEDNALVAYKTARNGLSSYVVRMGEEPSVPYLMSGWINGQHDGEESFAWSRGGRSTVLLRFLRGEDSEMSVRMRPHEGLKDRRVRVELNGSPIAELELEDGWKEYRIAVPAGRAVRGINKVAFAFGGTVRSSQDFGGAWTEGAAVEYLRKMYLPNQRDDEVVILDWEQDNTKFGEEDISAAFDYISVGPASR